jgi:hypothetical protein
MDKYCEVGDSFYYILISILRNQLQIQDEKILQQIKLELSQHTNMQIEYEDSLMI